jgi:peroxiredoxin Q/BCP
MISTGDSAPDFTLTDESGRSVSLSGLAGNWVVLYWYPKADTPGCTAQAEGFRDQIEAFNELNCVILGASFDEPSENFAFREKYRLPFKLLSDPNREVAHAYGAAAELDTPHAKRVAHLISPEGVIAKSYEVSDPGFFADQVLDDLEDLLS